MSKYFKYLFFSQTISWRKESVLWQVFGFLRFLKTFWQLSRLETITLVARHITSSSIKHDVWPTFNCFFIFIFFHRGDSGSKKGVKQWLRRLTHNLNIFVRQRNCQWNEADLLTHQFSCFFFVPIRFLLYELLFLPLYLMTHLFQFRFICKAKAGKLKNVLSFFFFLII